MELKKILVTGANGQLGNELRVLATEGCPGCEFLFTDIAELDICNAPAVESYVEQNGADVIINCAAFTAVDKAESEEALARKINADAPGILARAIENAAAQWCKYLPITFLMARHASLTLKKAR